METYVICAGPYEESLAIVGDPDFTSKNFLEYRTFLEQIVRESDRHRKNAFLFIETELRISAFSGTWRSDSIPTTPKELAYANAIEDGSPRSSSA